MGKLAGAISSYNRLVGKSVRAILLIEVRYGDPSCSGSTRPSCSRSTRPSCISEYPFDCTEFMSNLRILSRLRYTFKLDENWTFKSNMLLLRCRKIESFLPVETILEEVQQRLKPGLSSVSTDFSLCPLCSISSRSREKRFLNLSAYSHGKKTPESESYMDWESSQGDSQGLLSLCLSRFFTVVTSNRLPLDVRVAAESWKGLMGIVSFEYENRLSLSFVISSLSWNPPKPSPAAFVFRNTRSGTREPLRLSLAEAILNKK